MDEKIMALIRGGKIAEIRRATPEQPFHPDLPWDEFPPMHPDLVWIDITSLDPVPQLDWAYDDGVFSQPAPPPEPSLEEVKKAARQRLANEVNAFIAAKSDGSNRYEQSWMIRALNLKTEYRFALAGGGLTTEEETAINDRLTLIQQVETWVNSVMAVYYSKASEISAAQTTAEVEAVSWDLSTLEADDPDIYMEQLELS